MVRSSAIMRAATRSRVMLLSWIMIVVMAVRWVYWSSGIGRCLGTSGVPEWPP